MRIISPFHDYYDGVQAFGQDRSVVFMRDQSELLAVASEKLAAVVEAQLTRGAFAPIGYDWTGAKFTLSSSYFWVALAGKVYRGVRVRRRPYPFLATSRDTNLYTYTAAELHDALEDLGVEEVRCERRRWKRICEEEASRERKRWLEAQGTGELERALADEGHVILARLRGWRKTADGREPCPVISCPRLADYQFGRAMDAFRCYQELSMWVGGVLPQRDAMTTTVPDAVRLIKHGFDAKASFRNMPVGT